LETLASVLRDIAPFPNGLYWVTSSTPRLLPAVTELLENANLAGIDVAVVECKTFNELAAEVIKHVDLSIPFVVSCYRPARDGHVVNAATVSK
jgi:hypothetical protein